MMLVMGVLHAREAGLACVFFCLQDYCPGSVITAVICIMKPTAFFVLTVCLCFQTYAAELELVYRHGEPIQDRRAAWSGHIEFASWVDQDHIVYATRSGEICCISIKDRKAHWTVPSIGEISDWSISRETKRLAVLTDEDVTCVIDCANGKKLFSADQDRIAQLLQLRHVIPTRLVITPNDGRLVICNFSTFYGRNGYILAPTYDKLLSSFDIDATPRAITISRDSDRMGVIAADQVLCIREIDSGREVFFRGTRIKVKPDWLTATIDAPFFSHLRHDGDNTLVYTRDNSWSTGEVFVHDTDTDTVESFDARNGHIELDVSFKSQRIALTGTSTDLTILDFHGKLIAHAKKVSLQRNACTEFSPTEDRILVGSWDNTLSVYSIVYKSK